MGEKKHFVLYDKKLKLYIRINPFELTSNDIYIYTSDSSNAFAYSTYSGAKWAKQAIPPAYVTSHIDVKMIPVKV